MKNAPTNLSNLKSKVDQLDVDKLVPFPVDLSKLSDGTSVILLMLLVMLLAQENLANKNDIANFVKKTDFDYKLKNLNKKATSNKIKHVLLENELNELLEKVKPISTKGLINIVFLMEQSISNQEYYKIILNLYQLKTL